MPEPLTQFGPYRLLKLLGRGGMGEVWKAVDLRLEREVALKLILGTDPSQHPLLIKEARTACQLLHPHIAVIYEAGEQEGLPYIAMELLEGPSLRTVMDRDGAAEEDRLVQIALDAGSALAFAHNAGIIHRDIKPENLQFSKSGALKLVDFGIAQQWSPEEGPRAHTRGERTGEGYSRGTPSYMSPEQVCGEPLGPAMDQFCLGTVLYEFAAAQHPFKRETTIDTMHAILRDEPLSLHALRPDLPSPLCAAIHRMLAKDPAARFSDMAACQDAFRATRDGGGKGPADQEPLKTRPTRNLAPGAPDTNPSLAKAGRHAWVPLASAIVVLLLLGAWGFRRWLSAPPPGPTGGAPLVVAILPVEGGNADLSMAWMGDAFSEAMASALVRRSDVRVLDRGSLAAAAQQKGLAPGSESRLLEALKADVLVRGRFKTQGPAVRLDLDFLGSRGATGRPSLHLEGDAAQFLRMEEELRSRLPLSLGLQGAETRLGPHALSTQPLTRERYARADRLIAMNDLASLELAVELLRAAVKEEPDYAPAHAALGKALEGVGTASLYKGGDAGEPKRLLEEGRREAKLAVMLDPESPESYEALALCLLQLNELDEALSAARKATLLNPADARALMVEGASLERRGDPESFEAARQALSRALELAPEEWTIHYRLAVLMELNGMLEDAILHGRKASALNPDSEWPYVTTLNAELCLGHLDEAEQTGLQGLRAVPGSKVLRLRLAHLAFLRSDKATFTRLAESLRGAWAEDHPNARLLAGLRRGIAGDAKGMAQVFEVYLGRVMGQDWSHQPAADSRSSAISLYYMAQLLARAGLPLKAQPLLEEAERHYPNLQKLAAADVAFKHA